MIKITEKYIVDSKGNKKSVILPYREYEALKEDLHDLAIIAERKGEKLVSHKNLLKKLKKDGLI